MHTLHLSIQFSSSSCTRFIHSSHACNVTSSKTDVEALGIRASLHRFTINLPGHPVPPVSPVIYLICPKKAQSHHHYAPKAERRVMVQSSNCAIQLADSSLFSHTNAGISQRNAPNIPVNAPIVHLSNPPINNEQLRHSFLQGIWVMCELPWKIKHPGVLSMCARGCDSHGKLNKELLINCQMKLVYVIATNMEKVQTRLCSRKWLQNQNPTQWHVAPPVESTSILPAV